MAAERPLNKVSVCMLVLNEVRHDARVLKEAAALQAAGARVRILGMSDDRDVHKPGLPPGVTLVPRRRLSAVPLWPVRMALDAGFGALFHRQLAAAAARIPADVYHCHDLNTVWAGMRAAAGKARVIYDAHELFTERVGLHPLRAKLFGRYERRALHEVDRIIAASEPRARIMRDEYGAPHLPVTIMNAARRGEQIDEPPPEARRAREAIDAPHVILYQGGFIRGRGLSAVIDAFTRLPETYHLVLMGPGGMRGALAERVRRCGLETRVHVWPAVPPDQVVAWAAAADAGIITYLPTCRNNAYCAPNKLSEYAAAGLPMLAADLPGLRGFLDRYGLGESFVPGDPASFAAAAGRLFDRPERLARARLGARRLLEDVNWESQAAKLVGLYRELLDR